MQQQNTSLQCFSVTNSYQDPLEWRHSFCCDGDRCISRTGCRSEILIGSNLMFTALHGMQTRSSDENSVCPSVKRTFRTWTFFHFICDKMEERSVQIFISYDRSFSLVFWEEEWFVGVTPSTWNFGSNWPHWSEIADFQSIFARRASAVTHSEKSSINANRKSTTRFPMSLRWSSYVAPKPPKEGWKTQNYWEAGLRPSNKFKSREIIRDFVYFLVDVWNYLEQMKMQSTLTE